MRPLRLDVAGLTTFAGQQSLDFTTCDSLFAILGPTGSGKSSVLEAITFALYGRMPKAESQSLSIGDFIRTGQAQMSVVFACEVRQQQIRITRTARRPKTKSGTSTTTQTVLLERRDPTTGQWQNLNAAEPKKKPELDRQIVEWLGLNYDTFTRTVLLPQNQFARFLHGTTKERTAVLEELWDVQELAQIGEAARLHARTLEEESAGITRELARLAQYPHDWLETTRTAIDAETAELDQIATLKDTVQPVLEALVTHGRLVSDARAAVTQASAQERDGLRTVEELGRLADAQMELAPRLATLEQASSVVTTELQHITGQIAEVTEHARAWSRLQRRHAAWLSATERHAQAADRVATTERPDEARQAVLVAAVAAAQREQEQHEALAAAADAQVLVAAREAEQAARWRTVTAEVETLRERRRKAGPAVEEAVRAMEAAAVKVTEATAQLHTMSVASHRAHLQVGWTPGQPCPLCSTPVTELSAATGEPSPTDLEYASSVLDEAQQELQRCSARQAKLQAAADHLDEQILARTAALSELEASGAATADPEAVAVAQRAQHERRTQGRAVRARSEQAHQELIAWEQQQRQYADLVATVGGEAAVLQTAAEEMRAAMAPVGLDAMETVGAAIEAYEQTNEQLSGARRAVLARLAEAEAALTPARQQAAAMARDLADRTARLEQLTGQRGLAPSAQAAWLQARSQQLQARLTEAEQQVARLRATLQAHVVTAGMVLRPDTEGQLLEHLSRRQLELTQRVSTAREVLRQAEELVAKRPALEAAQRRLADEQARAALLGDLFRSNKFIAYYLGDGLRALAERASQELEEMSEGRFALVLDADQQFRILDHQLGDQERPVGTLSGGETFLVSLALALGLSEAVQAQAGSRASTDLLLIDEGFGGLDPQSLGQAMDALERLQARGHLVGIITHVEEMGERIPTGFRIEPGATGSLVHPRTIESSLLESEEGQRDDRAGTMEAAA